MINKGLFFPVPVSSWSTNVHRPVRKSDPNLYLDVKNKMFVYTVSSLLTGREGWGEVSLFQAFS